MKGKNSQTPDERMKAIQESLQQQFAAGEISEEEMRNQIRDAENQILFDGWGPI